MSFLVSLTMHNSEHSISKIPPSRESRRMIISLIVLTTMLAVSALFRVPTGLFAAFALLNACALSICGSYLQEAVISVGSLFGASAIQSIMAGQAAVAVAVSAVQVFSAAASLWGLSGQTIATYESDGSVEGRSALIFFSFSIIFLLFSALAHDRLVRKPIYKSIASPLEDRLLQSAGSSTEENTALASSMTGSKALGQTRIIDLMKANIIYLFAVSYTFFITLVCYGALTRNKVLLTLFIPECLSTNYGIYTTNKPGYPSSPVQLSSLSCVRHRRSIRTIHMLIPAAAHLVGAASFDSVVDPYQLRSSILDVQRAKVLWFYRYPHNQL